ncbi:hypothetical protein ME783_20210 [Lactobacillus delbrueckii]|nr:hypothetical protein ME783_20210 [Lactobacillus delbrueckii]
MLREVHQLRKHTAVHQLRKHTAKETLFSFESTNNKNLGL